MHSFTCHVTRRDEITRRVEVRAASIAEARAAALAGQAGRVSCRYSDAIAADVVRAIPSFRRDRDLQ